MGFLDQGTKYIAYIIAYINAKLESLEYLYGVDLNIYRYHNVIKEIRGPVWRSLSEEVPFQFK